MTMKVAYRAGETSTPTSARTSGTQEDVLPSGICDDGSLENLEWTADFLYEQLLSIGWVQSVFDEVAENLRRQLGPTSEE